MDNNSSSLMHSFSENKKSSGLGMSISVWIIVGISGVGTGYIMSKNMASSSLNTMIPGGNNNNGSVSTGKFYGSSDTKLYKDSTEGTLKKGGIEGEGQFHLIRPGGDSQNVYLISSTVDLSQFLDKKIKVWGQTQAAQKAGWLMDVGRVQVL